ncbi:MAG: copper-binding protein [Gallionella sp.]
MKTKQSGVLEKVNARLGERCAVTKKQIWMIALLLSGTALPALAELPMTGMEMKKVAAQASHQGAGKVVSVDKSKLTVKLAHEAIKSLGWPGMTMDFNVMNAKLLEGLKAGDLVTFELGQGNKPDEWLIIRITPRGSKK